MFPSFYILWVEEKATSQSLQEYFTGPPHHHHEGNYPRVSVVVCGCWKQDTRGERK